MLGLLEQILKQAMERVSSQLLNYAPGVLAAIFILVISIIVAKGVRWLLLKIIKGIAIDRFLSKVGLHTDVDTWKTPQVAAQFAYVLILALGALSALDSFNSELTSRLIETTVMLCPKLLIAAAIYCYQRLGGPLFQPEYPHLGSKRKSARAWKACNCRTHLFYFLRCSRCRRPSGFRTDCFHNSLCSDPGRGRSLCRNCTGH
jgi:hypothetical protein